MKFAFISLDFRRFPLEYCFKMAERYGFDGVELWAGRPHAFPPDMDEKAVADILAWQRAYNVKTPMLTPHVLGGNYRLTSLCKKERDEAVALFKAHFDVAARLGCPMLLVTADHPGCTANMQEVWRVFCDSAYQLAEYGAALGVKAVVEPLTPMESPVITTADDCLRLFSDVGHDNLYAMLDVVPPTVAYEPLSAYFDKLGDRLAYIHICNSDGATEAHLRLDSGVISVCDMMQVFTEHGYNGWVSAELYSESCRDPELLLAGTARVLKEVLATM